MPTRAPEPVDNKREQQQLNQQNSGGPHPRGETKGLAPALEQMLFQKEERRRRKMEGTPGYPNQPLGPSATSPDQIEWEQFNTRKVDDRDPLRQLDKNAAELARQRSAAGNKELRVFQKQERPWSLLDRAIRATDQVLQAGGFRVIVLDLAFVALRSPPRYKHSRFSNALSHCVAARFDLTANRQR